MTFSIKEVARDYIYRRFPRASIEEKEKYVRDWDKKIENSRLLVQDFKERVGDPLNLRILDVGSGNGGISIAFGESGARISGIEIEQELYDIGKEHASSIGIPVDFYLYDGFKLPFEDNSFDSAISASVLEHTDDPVFYLNEILRVVRPDGYLYLGFPNKWTPRETHTQLLFLTYLPKFLREKYISLFHRNPLPDNNLHFYSYFDLIQIISSRDTGYIWEIVKEEGKSNSFLKKIIKKILTFFGLSYKAFLPHILVILKKKKIL